MFKYGFFFTIGAWAAKAAVAGIVIARGKYAAKKAAQSISVGIKELISDVVDKVNWSEESTKIIEKLKEDGIGIDIQEDPDKYTVTFEKK